MAVIIQNAGIEPLTLPFPLRRVLAGKQRVSVALTVAQVAAYFGGDVPVGVTLTDIPDATPNLDSGVIGGASAARGVGLTVAGSVTTSPSMTTLSVRPRLRRPLMQDYFVGGNLVTGSIGALGWNLLGTGTPVVSRNNGNFNTRTLNLDTSASSGNVSALVLGDTLTRGVANPVEMTIIQGSWDFNNDLATVRRFFGFSSDFGADPTGVVSGLGIIQDSTLGPNYYLIGRSASAGAPIDTGVPVPANTGELVSMVKPGGSQSNTWSFYSGSTLLGATDQLGANMNLGFRVETLTAGSKRWRLGGFLATGDIVGTLDDDSFLET
jgi:hypothetical protein